MAIGIGIGSGILYANALVRQKNIQINRLAGKIMMCFISVERSARPPLFKEWGGHFGDTSET